MNVHPEKRMNMQRRFAVRRLCERRRRTPGLAPTQTDKQTEEQTEQQIEKRCHS